MNNPLMNNPSLFGESVVNHIRARMGVPDHEGSVPDDVLKLIYEQGLFKCFVPDTLNGNMKPLPEALRLFEDAARIDGNFGWIVAIGCRGGYFSEYIDPEKVQEVYQDKTAVVAGSGFPSGRAQPVEGGYEVSGSWKYCSGSLHATKFAFGCETSIPGTPTRTEIRTFILNPNQVHVVEDWDAFGLRSTGSHTVQVKNQFVENAMSFLLFKNHQQLHNDIYSYPFQSLSEASFAAIAIGLAWHFMDEAQNVAEKFREAWEASHLSRYEFVMNRIDTQRRLLQETTDNFYRLVESNWGEHTAQKGIPVEEWHLLSKSCRRAARVALGGAHAIFPFLGTTAILERSAINRIYRDLHTACQNALLVPFDEDELTD